MEHDVATNYLDVFVLHPALGLGEDWNLSIIAEVVQSLSLHPALGLGEDWNSTFMNSAKAGIIAPGFRAG